VKLMNTQPMIVQLCLLLITQFSVGRVVTIMHKLHSHHFKRIIIFKILMDMHLLMFPLLEQILRKHCMHSLKSKRQSTLNLLKAWQILKILLQNSHLLSVFRRKVSSHLNHSKIPKGNTIQVQVAPETNTWIKSNQSLLSTVVRLLKNQFLNLVRKMMSQSQSLRVRKGLNLDITKNRLIPHQYFHFLMLWPNKEKSIMILKSLKLSNRKESRMKKAPKMLSRIICQNWQ